MSSTSTRSGLDQLAVLPPRSRAEQLADTLVEHIRRRGLAPGDQLGTLDEIRAEVGFARTTVSEAVRLLRERGMLEIRPGRGGGLFIADETPVVRIRHTLLSVPGSAASVRDAIELRESLEEAIAVSAAAACRADDAARLRRAVQRMARTDLDFEEFLRRNWHLHELIAELSPNAMLRAVYTSCLGYLHRSAASYDDAEAVADYIAERAAIHAELVEAIVADDAERIRAAVEAHHRDGEEQR